MRIAMALFLTTLLSTAASADGRLPIVSSDFPGVFVLVIGDDVADDPPSLLVQIGQNFPNEQAIEPSREALMPPVDANGDTVGAFQRFRMELEGVTLEPVPGGEPAGYIRLRPDGTKLDVQFDMRMRVTISLEGPPLPPIEQDVRLTTAGVHADRPPTILARVLLGFDGLDLNGKPFDAITGEGQLVSAFNVPQDLPPEVVELIGQALTEMLGIPVSGSLVLGAPVGIRLDSLLMSAVVEGDANGDGCVNVSDYVQVRTDLGLTGSGLEADLNGDGVVNVTDLVLVRINLGNGPWCGR